MSIKKKEQNKLTDLCEEAILAEVRFTNCVKSRVEKLKDARDISVPLDDKLIITEEELLNLENKQKENLSISNKLIRKIYNDLNLDGKEKVELYLGKTRASDVANNSDKTVTFIKEILSKVDSEGHNDINSYKSKLINIRKDLRELSKEIYNKKTDVKLLDIQSDNNFSNWKSKYSTLKDFVKGESRELGIDYKIFFYDLKG